MSPYSPYGYPSYPPQPQPQMQYPSQPQMQYQPQPQYYSPYGQGGYGQPSYPGYSNSPSWSEPSMPADSGFTQIAAPVETSTSNPSDAGVQLLPGEAPAEQGPASNQPTLDWSNPSLSWNNGPQLSWNNGPQLSWNNGPQLSWNQPQPNWNQPQLNWNQPSQQPPLNWNNNQGFVQGPPNWEASFTPMPNAGGCYNRCRPKCALRPPMPQPQPMPQPPRPKPIPLPAPQPPRPVYGCRQVCRPQCNVRPTCGGGAEFNGNTMVCGRPNYGYNYNNPYGGNSWGQQQMMPVPQAQPQVQAPNPVQADESSEEDDQQ